MSLRRWEPHDEKKLVLSALVVALGALVVTSIPDFQRYLKIRSM